MVHYDDGDGGDDDKKHLPTVNAQLVIRHEARRRRTCETTLTTPTRAGGRLNGGQARAPRIYTGPLSSSTSFPPATAFLSRALLRGQTMRERIDNAADGLRPPTVASTTHGV